MADIHPVKYILVPPPCGFCWDKDAVYEITTVWGAVASMCGEHAEQFRRNGSPFLRLLPGPGRDPLPTPAEAGRYVESQTWQHSQPRFRGRPQEPHSYVLLRRSSNPYLQLRVLWMIRAHGEARRYGKSLHHYWRWGAHEYWAMPPRNMILNRRDLTDEERAEGNQQ